MSKLIIILTIISYIIKKNSICFRYGVHFLRTPKLLDRFNYKSKGENNRRIKSWGTLLGSQHFRGKRACWSSGMGKKSSDKRINYSHGPAQTKQQVS